MYRQTGFPNHHGIYWYKEPVLIRKMLESNVYQTLLQWASADFFLGRAKFSGGRGQKHTICLKMTKNILFSFIKVEKCTIFAGQGEQVPPLALPCGRP